MILNNYTPEHNFENMNLIDVVTENPNIKKYCAILSRYLEKKTNVSTIKLSLDVYGLAIEHKNHFIYLNSVNNFLDVAKFFVTLT